MIKSQTSLRVCNLAILILIYVTLEWMIFRAAALLTGAPTYNALSGLSWMQLWACAYPSK